MTERKITPWPEHTGGTLRLGTPEGNRVWRQIWDHIGDVMLAEIEAKSNMVPPEHLGEDHKRSKRKMPRPK